MISPQERARRQEAVDHAQAHLRIEGLEVSPEAQALLERYIDGEITVQELIERTLALYGHEQQSSRERKNA